ncbi:MAG: aminotransferase class III-fold pyridoxal phosphate-dependent enzyme, partial [Ginsengibacter sp.]
DSTALDGHLIPGLSPTGVPRELKDTSVPFMYNDMESFENALKKLGGNLAAVVMEPMRSQFPEDDFVAKVAARCRESGAVFIVDEITSGLRYGFPGALSKVGVDPDIVVYAKAMSNGFPFAAIIGREQVMTDAEASFISSSYWTDGVGPAAALAVLEKMQRLNVQEVVWNKGVKFKKALQELAMRYPACKLLVAGMPASPTLAFQLGELSSVTKNVYIKKMLEKGFLVSSIFYLMYAHKEHHIEQALQALERVFAEIEEMIIKGKLSQESEVDETHKGFARLA